MKIGDKGVESLIAETDDKAFKMADQTGIRRRNIRRMYDLYFPCNLDEYPMYLLGPGAPQLKMWKDCFEHDYRDNPVCQYQIVIRDQDEEDKLHDEWLTECAQRMKEKGIRGFQREGNWSPNVMRDVKKRMRELAKMKT
jgi:hypothetical protein